MHTVNYALMYRSHNNPYFSNPHAYFDNGYELAEKESKVKTIA